MLTPRDRLKPPANWQIPLNESHPYNTLWLGLTRFHQLRWHKPTAPNRRATIISLRRYLIMADATLPIFMLWAWLCCEYFHSPHIILREILKRSLSFFWFPPIPISFLHFDFIPCGSYIMLAVQPLVGLWVYSLSYGLVWNLFSRPKQEGAPWVGNWTPRSGHVVFVEGGLRPTRGSRNGRRPVGLPLAGKNGTGRSVRNGTRGTEIILGPIIWRRNLTLPPQDPRLKADWRLAYRSNVFKKWSGCNTL